MKTYATLALMCLFMMSGKNTLAQTVSKNTHIVKPNETLYSLLKKYKLTETEFLGLNPGFNINVPLKINQELIIAKPIISQAQVKVKAEKATIVNKPTPASNTNGIHIVGPSETIFSIAKKYQLDIAEFVSANNLTDNLIKTNQKLIVDIDLVKKINQKYKPESYVINTNGKKVVEEGIAEVVETKNRTRKFLALHKTAPKGSIIKVTNEANGQFITAKVVGNLHAKGPDEKIMLKLSPLAYYQLKPKDSKIRAKVEFYKPM